MVHNMASVDTYFVIMQIELLILLGLMVYMIIIDQKKRQHKPDMLLKHFKEYIAEGYTFGQAKEKLEKIGFEKERVNKLMTDFLRH